MNDVKSVEELKEVLSKVSRKIVVVRYVRFAISFQFFLVVMAGYYVLISPMKSFSLWLTVAYWSVSIAMFVFISRIIWKKVYSGNKKLQVCISFSWLFSALFCWLVVPVFVPMGTFQKIAVSLLSFVSLAVFLMIVSIKAFTGSLEKLMLPALLIPVLAIPLIPLCKNPVYFAGMSIALGYGTTVLLYLTAAVSGNVEGLSK